MDIVITYVNGLDPIWQQEYAKHTNTPILEKRFRDWGTLKYLFRGIETNMPFIRKVHLVVSGESQVPKWLNREQVNIVLHKDIIPAQLLPTFNCNPIEMHLHNIADLDEEYIYFNDDIFPLLPCQPTDFFRNGKGVLGMSKHLLAWDMFKKICRNSDRLARKILGLKPQHRFLRPQHTCQPMLKSEIKAVYDRLEKEILGSMTTTRSAKNLNQYLYLDYMYLNGKIINERLSKKHFSVGWVSAGKLRKFIERPTHKLTCINDVHLSESRYTELRTTLIEAFERSMPNKSKYEI
jgi:hypothetical protein